ncbi:hypothetical protein [Auraticoccus monumenti]|uniref:hypothetical protein n=1 Tax=Auraticoccus monumenti TaxID=675864 RepID=UPI0012F73D44|nr:hypothetical protein [Auraticoccus monumenti]
MPVTPPGDSAAYDWSETNLPWAYTSQADIEKNVPAGTTIVDLSTNGATFYDRLANTLTPVMGRAAVRLPAGAHRLSSFRLVGSSGLQDYSFGFWFPKLQGFIGPGADKCFVEMGPNSMSQAQLDFLHTMDKDEFRPNQMSVCRLDGTSSSPVIWVGVTGRSWDQQPLTVAGDWYGATVPQSAPHQGLFIYPGAAYIIDCARFQGFGKAMTAAPPFEHANLNTQKSPHGQILRTEIDGRRSPDIDAARPRVCGMIMVNNELLNEVIDSWMHHSYISRYAANDENQETSGIYRFIRSKIEQVSNTGQDGKGGSNNQASCLGWESVNGTIEIEDSIVSQDNPRTTGSLPHHFSLTSTGHRNPRGGRLKVRGNNIFRNTGFPSVDGFLSIRAISSTYWVLDGYPTTMDVRDSAGVRKTAHQVTGTWPPSAASLAAAGVTPATHFLVRG